MEGNIGIYDGGIIFKKRFGNHPSLLYFCVMILLTITIIALLYSRKYFPTHIKTINIVSIVLTVWLITGFTIRQFTSSGRGKVYTDVEMAQTWIKDNPELKAKMKVMDDGTVKIILKKRKYLYLKDGVITSKK